MQLLDISKARTYETAIEIISEESVNQGIYFLHSTFVREQGKSSIPTVVMPVLQAGQAVAESVGRGTRAPIVPIRMSHTKDHKREAICIVEPSLDHILLPNGETANIAVADCVMETVGTLWGLMSVINGMIEQYNFDHNAKYLTPDYSFYILVDKTREKPSLFNLTTAFKASPDIWYHGFRADDEERGREKTSIWGRLPDGFNGSMPSPPYFRQKF